jgi:hypothetical protein
VRRSYILTNGCVVPITGVGRQVDGRGSRLQKKFRGCGRQNLHRTPKKFIPLVMARNAHRNIKITTKTIDQTLESLKNLQEAVYQEIIKNYEGLAEIRAEQRLHPSPHRHPRNPLWLQLPKGTVLLTTLDLDPESENHSSSNAFVNATITKSSSKSRPDLTPSPGSKKPAVKSAVVASRPVPPSNNRGGRTTLLRQSMTQLHRSLYHHPIVVQPPYLFNRQ